MVIADLIFKTAVKNALENHNTSADFSDALDERVSELLDNASEP